MARDIPHATRGLLAARSGGRCELNPAHPAQEAQHRDPRGMGGSRGPGVHSLANLLHLCAACHRWIETLERAISYELGWLIHTGQPAAGVPVLLATEYGEGWYTLDAAGGRQPDFDTLQPPGPGMGLLHHDTALIFPKLEWWLTKRPALVLDI